MILQNKLFIFLSCLFFSVVNLQASNQDIVKMLKKTMPSVVSIYVSDNNDSNFFVNTNRSVGSGVILKKSGLIVTNYHVIGLKPIIKVMLFDGRIFNAKIIHTESTYDIALLQIDDLDSEINEIAISKKEPEIGEQVFAIGNPHNIGISASTGIVSAIPSKTTNLGLGNFIQTDAAINPGSSGGALVDSLGNLIGINTFIVSSNNGFSGIGFAIPVNLISLIVDRFISGKQLKQYWLGLGAVNVDSQIAKKNGLTIPNGVIITEIFSNSPAEQAKLMLNDIILKLEEHEIKSLSDLSFYIASIDDERPLKMEIFRNKKVVTVTIIPSIPQDIINADKTKINKGIFKGITIANNNNSISYELNTSATQGVVIYSIDNSSNLARFGIKKGDFINKINNIDVVNVKQLLEALDTLSNLKSYNLVFMRNNNSIDINISSSSGF
jgi:S1-C subfamily serine protease